MNKVPVSAECRSSSPYWWLKTSTFIITSTLHDYIQKNDIPEAEAIQLSFIQNEVIKLCHRAEVDERGYIRINRRVWFDKCGMDYLERLALLTSIGELEIDHSYCYLSHLSTVEHVKTHVPRCKGFKVPYDKIKNGLVRVDYKKRANARPLKPQYLQPTHIPVSRSSFSLSEEEEGRNSKEGICVGSEMHYLLSCLQQVIVTPELILTTDPIRDALSKQYLERTHYKAYGLHRAKTGRVFHSIIEMPKEGRRNLRHISGERFVNIDIKTCHPHLLLPLFSDLAERASFYQDLTLDLYNIINRHCDRDSVKRRTCQYLMQTNRKAEWLKDTDVHHYFYAKFPIFWQERLSENTGLAKYLQGEESEIVTRELVEYAKANGLFIITMHDGLLTLARDKDALMQKLKELLKEHTGYSVGVEERKLAVEHDARQNTETKIGSTTTTWIGDILEERAIIYAQKHRILPSFDADGKIIKSEKPTLHEKPTLYEKVEKDWRDFVRRFCIAAPKKLVPKVRGKGMKSVVDWDNISRGNKDTFRKARRLHQDGLEKCAAMIKVARYE